MPTYSYLNDITSSTAELNILDGCTTTFTELNILDGATATTAEVNLLDVSTATNASSSTFLRGDGAWQAVEHLTVRNAGTTLTERGNLKFDGTHMIATDDSGNDETDITLSTNLQALSGLTSAANKGIQYTGDGTAGVYDLTTAGKALLDDADATAQRVTLGSVIGTDVQAFDADLLAIAGLTSAADKGIQFTGSGAAATYDLTTAGKALLDDANASAQRTTLGLVIGTDVQAYDADLTAIAGLTSAANKGIQFTGSGAAAVYDLTTAGKALLDDANAAAQRTTLGLGTIATVAAPSGTVVGTTDTQTLTNKTLSTGGSISSGFGNIDIGSSALTATGTTTVTGTLLVPYITDGVPSLNAEGQIALGFQTGGGGGYRIYAYIGGSQRYATLG